MRNLLEGAGSLYHPQSALVIYGRKTDKNDCYVECFDMDKDGYPINAHPLSVKEAQQMARALDTSQEGDRAFLKPMSILPSNVLYIDPSPNGFAMWYTKACRRQLYFIHTLDIPCGKASVPPMLWVASKNKLYVFALTNNRKPNAATQLYHAPFFNVYQDGHVCMGTVDVNIKRSASLEEFMEAWEGYFFNSYFSHLMQHNPVNGNCVSIWLHLIDTDKAFPTEVLMKADKTIKSILK